ncbi:MAG: hypothetical protein KA716_06975 [Gloeotrichia echinulata DEX184]|nr:hypothetical protein [Gloeotrichia echinulata DEX184]
MALSYQFSTLSTQEPGPAKGYIEVEGTGLKAFFVPGKDYQKGSFESKNVTCYLGFSYSGLRAWEVTS